uniref:Phage protein n=1 Tax=Globodera pallida TaxID=36090 RepID=A0A183CFA2_GLOPA
MWTPPDFLRWFRWNQKRKPAAYCRLSTTARTVVMYSINGERWGKRIIDGDNVSELFPFVTLEGPLDRIEANFEGTYEFKTD